ncbi:ADP-ribose pyrophosphatase [Alicyclobacillus tengchongensis]|nr:ADP-ribose pyrophosphatase [Alicyclobacillus tengchongensis]
MIHHEETIGEESLFTGRMIQLKRLTVKLPNGSTSTREVVVHPGAVAVLAEVKPGSIVLVQQYRKPCEKTLWEIPAGKLEPGEAPEQAALRELAEETGYVAKDVQLVYRFFTAPGFTNERLHVYFTSVVEAGEVHPDADEFVEARLFTRDEVERMLENGEIEDAKTLVALYWWRQNGR